MDFYKKQAQKGMPSFDEKIIRQISRAEDYMMSPALERAVNMALYLGQPLLLTGQPGTGKTELARHLASHFSDDGSLKNLYVFNTKTTSVASDLFYQYDSLRHFQYAQKQENKQLDPNEVEQRFIRYQALGEAIKSNQRAIVLIDEIDKAPRDLPNDILDVLEHLSFEVPEIGYIGNKRIKTSPENRPLVILTSNSEKNLPDAFLRRCVFFHIPFPSPDQLNRILMKKTSGLSEEQLTKIVDLFQEIREQCHRKQPATAELLQWMKVLEVLHQNKKLNIDHLDNPNEEENEILKSTYSILVKDKEDLKEVLNI